ILIIVFFSSRRRHTISKRDWSSDVCSSDLCTAQGRAGRWRDPLGIQILRCMIFVTSCEFITGIIVNKWLNLGIWDYSNVPFQLRSEERRVGKGSRSYELQVY